MSAFADCTPECAIPVPCPTCGNPLPPKGRSVPLACYLPSCCDAARFEAVNTRHLWDETELTERTTP